MRNPRCKLNTFEAMVESMALKKKTVIHHLIILTTLCITHWAGGTLFLTVIELQCCKSRSRKFCTPYVSPIYSVAHVSSRNRSIAFFIHCYKQPFYCFFIFIVVFLLDLVSFFAVLIFFTAIYIIISYSYFSLQIKAFNRAKLMWAQKNAINKKMIK